VHPEKLKGSEPLFQLRYLKSIFLAVSVAMFNQLAGVNATLYYLNDIFAMAGFGKISSDIQAVAVGAMNLVATLVAMVLIDRIGRRMLLLIGSVGLAICLSGNSWIFLFHRHQDWLVYLLVGYIGFFAVSHGAVIWVFIGEVFPNRVRAKGQALCSSTHWVMNAIISGIFPVLATRSGAYPFLFFTAMVVLQFIVVFFCYPETKGFTLEQFQNELGIVWESAAFVAGLVTPGQPFRNCRSNSMERKRVRS
jgi:SP family arabinose:H+ symporter-like MFS transporter